MDAGIKPVVALLRYIGIRTVSSCDGHDGSCAYVTFTADSSKANEIADMLRKVFWHIALEEIRVELSGGHQILDMLRDERISNCWRIELINFPSLGDERRRVAEGIYKLIREQRLG